MRQRRPSLVKSTNNDGINIPHSSSLQQSSEARTAPASKKSEKSNSIAVISGVFGFVVSTCVLIYFWSMYQNRYHSDTMNGKEGSIHWDWSRYSGPIGKNSESRNPEPRYLIVQITPDEASEHMQDALDITSKVNSAYAKKWKIDYAIATLPEMHSTDDSIEMQSYIKILHEILMIGLSTKSESLDDGSEFTADQTITQYPYDFVWIFKDPSMMPVNFEISIFDDYTDFLLTSLSHFSTNNDGSQSVSGKDHNFGLNDAALLWNLHHPHIFMLLRSWEMLGNLGHALSKTGQTSEQPLWSEVLDDTSMFYHFSLYTESDLASTDAILGEEAIQPNENHTHSTSLIKLQSVADLVCFRYFPSCDVL